MSKGDGHETPHVEEIGARLPRDLLDAMDAYVARQPDGRISRADVIGQALRDWLAERGLLDPKSPNHADLSEKIAQLDAKAASLIHDGTPSPANALKTMNRALAKNEATKLRNKLAKAKSKGRS